MRGLAEPGEVFAAQVTEGREVLFRVLAAHGESRCVLATRHVGAPVKSVPRVASVFQVQAFTYQQLNRGMLGAWVDGPPPAAFRFVGPAPLRSGEVALVLHPQPVAKLARKAQQRLRDRMVGVGSWHTLHRDARNQWRWDHEREAVLAEAAAVQLEHARADEASLAAQARARTALKNKGVASLAGKRFYAAWKGSVPAQLIKAAEATMQAALKGLTGQSPAQSATRLVSLVKAFNKLDGRYGHDFDTTDAEDIMQAISTLAIACQVKDQVFRHRIDAAREF